MAIIDPCCPFTLKEKKAIIKRDMTIVASGGNVANVCNKFDIQMASYYQLMALSIKISDAMENRSSAKTLKEYNDSPVPGPIMYDLLQFVMNITNRRWPQQEKKLSERHAASTTFFVRCWSKPSILIYIV